MIEDVVSTETETNAPQAEVTPPPVAKPLPEPAAKPAVPKEMDPDRLSALFQGVDKFDQALPDNVRESITKSFSHAVDPNGQRQRVANQIFLSTRYKKPLKDITENYELYRSDYARKAYGWEMVDDSDLYKRAGIQLKQEKDEKVMLNALAGDFYQNVVNKGISTQDFVKMKLPEMAKMPGYNKEHLDTYNQILNSHAENIQKMETAEHDNIDAVSMYFKLSNKGFEPSNIPSQIGQEEELKNLREKAVSALANKTKEQQDFILLMASHGAKAPESTAGQKVAGRIERGFSKFISSSIEGAENVMRMDPESAAFLLPADNPKKRTAERRLDEVYSGKVNPMDSTNFISKVALDTAESAPRIAAMFTGPGIALNLLAAQSELQGQYEDKGVDQTKAKYLALSAAIPQTALQFVSTKMIAGKVPGLENWIASLPNLASRITATAGMEAGVIGAATAAQMVTPAAIQQLGASLTSSIPGVNWTQELENFESATPEALLQMLPLIMIGTGVASFKSEKYGKQFVENDHLMQAAGYPEEVVAQVKAASTFAEKAQILENNFGERVFAGDQQAALDQVSEPHNAGALTKREIEAGKTSDAPVPPSMVADKPLPPIELPEELKKTELFYKQNREKGEKVKFDLTFAGDVEKALLATSGKRTAKIDAPFRSFLAERGYSEVEIAEYGKAIRNSIDAQAKGAPAGELKVEYVAPKPEKEVLVFPEVKKEIYSPAVKTEDGEIFTGVNHDSIGVAGERGFVTNEGDFVDRKEAMRIAKDRNQLAPGFEKEIDLHSHMLDPEGLRLNEAETLARDYVQPVEPFTEEAGYLPGEAEKFPPIPKGMSVDHFNDLMARMRAIDRKLNSRFLKNFDRDKLREERLFIGEELGHKESTRILKDFMAGKEGGEQSISGTIREIVYSQGIRLKSGDTFYGEAKTLKEGTVPSSLFSTKGASFEDIATMLAEQRGMGEKFNAGDMIDLVQKAFSEQKGKRIEVPIVESLFAPPPPETKAMVRKNEDGTYTVKDRKTGETIGQANTAEWAAQIADTYETRLMPDDTVVKLEAIETPAQKSKTTKAIEEAQKLGAASDVGNLGGLVMEAKATADAVTNFLRNIPKLEGFKRIINEWQGQRQVAGLKMTKLAKEVKRIAPDRVVRQGIANWIDAGGDTELLQARYNVSKDVSLKKGYEAALKLKPEELKLAETIKQWFDKSFERAKQAGIMGDNDFRQNYVTQIIERPYVGGGVASEFYGKLSKNFKFSEARTFPNYGELEAAGFNVKTKDIGEIMAVYDAALTKAIETRKMIDALTKVKTPEGEPLAYRGKAPEGVESDYKTIDHPSLRNVKFHPDIQPHLRNILGQSAITEWYEQPGSPALQLGKGITKFVDEANRTVANTMLSGISSFHLVHEAKRALGNRIDIFNLKQIDPVNDPMVTKAVTEGLIIGGEHSALAEFTEGTGGHQSLTDRVPVLGPMGKAVSDFTFNNAIPRIKYSAWLALRERNLKLLSKEIAAGKVTESDVGYLAAQQVNARFGHLNKVDLGKNPTMQHIARMLTLAPDFWESNVRNYGQVLSGLTMSKAGAEPLKAFLLTGMVTFIAARALNSAVNDDHDPHFEEPFGVVDSKNNRVYTMRSETEDIWRMYKNTRGYFAGRFSPTFMTLINLIEGKNWRGEKQSPEDAFRDYIAKSIPLSLKWVPGVSALADWISPTEKTKTVSMFQEFLGSQGIQVGRKSDINESYALANKWKKEAGKKEDAGTYPVSKYQGIRYALEDQDSERLKVEIEKMDLKSAEDLKKVSAGARSSILHPWTGNKDDDEVFIAGLDPKDRHKVLTAQWKRETMFADFEKALAAYAKEKNLKFYPKTVPSKIPRDVQTSFKK